jgi:nicotinamide phosphoribosyltransferase
MQQLVNTPWDRVSTNFILSADSYKFSHGKQLDPNIKYMNSYIEPRKSSRFNEVLYFGLQAYLKSYLSNPITKLDVDYAEQRVNMHGLPFDREGWDIIVNEYKGHLPIMIEAIDEGSVVPLGTPLVQVRNTDPRFPWLPAFIETAMHRAIWYPTTVATLSREAKKIIYRGLQESSDDPDGQILFKLHDFGGRGVSSGESAMLGGMAHLVNFMGTDTVEALEGAYAFYGDEMAGFSIPASEHSTVTSWGREREYEMFDRFLQVFGGKNKLYACVSDSYDIYKAISDGWGGRLKQRVRAAGGTLVIRPDSGSPIEDVMVKVSNEISDAFENFTFNSKGYLVWEPCVRAIQGDGCTLETIQKAVDALLDNNISLDNWAFGMGGGLLQKVNRDDLSFAMKTNAASYDGTEWFDVVKDPITDPGKKSKGGIQEGPFKTRYINGVMDNMTTFSEIRENAKL